MMRNLVWCASRMKAGLKPAATKIADNSSLGGRVLVVAIAMVVLAGCARHVVVDPSQAGSLNSADWTVKSQPQAAEPQKKEGP